MCECSEIHFRLAALSFHIYPDYTGIIVNGEKNDRGNEKKRIRFRFRISDSIVIKYSI